MSDLHQLEERLFAEALELPPPDRPAFVTRSCPEGSELRRRLDALLAAHDALPTLTALPRPATAPAGEPPSQLRSGASRYVLEEKIGEGGCGVVYRAEQMEPVRRKVALKIIKLGMDTESVIARFEVERQALALMDHPSIARVFDAGATAAGRPFFVMELVPGVRITTYCDQQQVGVEQRLRLFLQACRAVQHAHQKGVIHRDLKPSNLLIITPEGGPALKVIDFGIAKATAGRLTDHTLVTVVDQFIGTPAYMSPEQVEFDGLDVDTRTDVYSLGVLLYELLTGRTPLDGPELARAGPDEIRRRIREADPVRPSLALRALDRDNLATVAAHRQLTGAKLVNRLRGDLDWIVLRCLEKDRTRRYETVDALALDLERYLRHEPVEARPPSAPYTLGKFVRRHRPIFITGSAVALALLIGTIVSTVLFLRERAARGRAVSAERAQAGLRGQAEAEKSSALTAARRSSQTAQFMEAMLQSVGPSVARGRDTTLMREIADATSLRLDRELGDQPELQADLQGTLGEVYAALGEQARAEALRRKVLVTRRRFATSPAGATAMATALNRLGETLRLEGKPVEAEAGHREALAIQVRLLGPDATGLSETLDDLALALLAQSLPPVNRKPEAEAIARRAVALERNSPAGAGPKTLGVLATALRREHAYAEAETLFREVLAFNPGDGDALYQLGDDLLFTNKSEEAEARLRQALAVKRQTLNGLNPQLVTLQSELADLLVHEGRIEEAEAMVREIVAVDRQLLDRENSNQNFTRALAIALSELGEVLSMQHRYPAAEAADREALGLHERALGNVNREGIDLMHRVADDLWAEGQFAEAEAFARRTLAVEEKVLDERVSDSIERIVAALRRDHRPVATDPLWTETLAVAQRLMSHVQPLGTAYTSSLAIELIRHGRAADAEPLVKRNLARLEATKPDSWYVFVFRYLQGAVLTEQGRFAEAEPLLLSADAGLEKRRWIDIPDRSQFHVQCAAAFVAKLYADWGKSQLAADWLVRSRH
jgi:eukaryotic-like serine/threonine-protein kinase